MTKPKVTSQPFDCFCRFAAAFAVLLAMLSFPAPGYGADSGAKTVSAGPQIDSNGDTVVSREEFLRYRLRLFIGREEDRPDWDARSRFAFTACDTNGDGVLSADEMHAWPECGA